jgi:hypothetical protein
MGLSYLNGIINNQNEKMEDIGIIYPKGAKPLRKIRKNVNKFSAVKKGKKLIAMQINKIQKILASGKVSDARIKKTLQLRLIRLQSKLNGIEIAEIGKPKRKAKRTKPQLIKKLKQVVAKQKARNKADKHSPKEKLAHKIAKVAMAVPRGAFLGLILLGKALEKTPIKLNLAKNLRDNWSSKGKAIEKLWYKLGGEIDILKTQISKGTNVKLSGHMGVVVAATTAGTLAAASPIVVKLLAILGKGQQFAKNNPKLLAVGEKLLKGKLQNFAAKKGKSEELSEVSEVVGELTENLPAATRENIDEQKEEVSEKLVQAVEQKADEEVAQTKENIQTENENLQGTEENNKTMLYVGIGTAAIIGGYLLSKKK